MAHAWRVAFVFLLLVGAALAGHVDAADTANVDPTSQCIRLAPQHLSRDQAARLCIHAADGLGDGPAQCAASAQKLSGFTASNSAEVTDDVLRLCEWAADGHPAECWRSVMTSQIYRSSEWRQALVAVCGSANDTAPAQCLMEFKRSGLTPTKRSTSRQDETTMDVAIEICKSFGGGDTRAIGPCLSRAPRSLSEIARYRLCQHGNASAVPDVVECANQLLQRTVKPEIVARVCATAAKPDDQPQKCVLAAQQQARWMDDAGAVAHLCERSQATVAPVQCAVALRSWFVTQFTKEHTMLDLARLCRGAVDSTTIVECVGKLPNKLFQVEQVVRLCAHNATKASHERVGCVLDARLALFGSGHQFADEDALIQLRDEQAALLMELCEGAEVASATLECVASTATQNPPFSPQQRVRLCQRASSPAPHQCFRALHASLLAHLPSQTADGVELCREATSLAPATCANQLEHSSTAFLQSGSVVELCRQAPSAAPAECYHAAPTDFVDRDKIALCAHASSDAPATCAKVYLPRMAGNSMMAALCAKATSAAPAQCASASPFGMSALEIVTLCREATDDKPAQCARALPPNLRVPWRDVATTCRGAATTTPGSCLAHRVRQRVPLTSQVILECRSMVSTAATIEIVQFSYECPELMPRCPVIVKARVLDQFGDEMPTLSHGYVHLSAVPDADETAALPVVRGVTVTQILNGSVLFRELHFAEAGNFTLRLSSPDVEDTIARVHVRINETEQRERAHCARVFSFMECAPAPAPTPSSLSPVATTVSAPAHVPGDVPLQVLRLRNRFVLAGLRCESLWTEQHAGIRALATVGDAKLFALPRVAYQLLTGHNIPTVAMSAWECLGIPEGSNRSAIRRAYHKRSLEWHPDKWSFGDAAALRDKVEAVFAHISRAYEQLVNTPESPN